MSGLYDIIRDKWLRVIAVIDVAVLLVRTLRGLPAQSNIVVEVLLVAVLIGLSVLTITDAREKRIPNRILLAMLIAWGIIVGGYIVVRWEEGLALLLVSLAASAFSGISFLACYLVTRGQLGAGDVKLAFILGLYVGTARIFGVLIYGMVLCCIYSLYLLLRKRVGMKDGLPLVPFLYIGLCITLVML